MNSIATETGDSPRGIYVIVPTPLKDNEELDSPGLKHLLNYYVESRCHGVVVLGSGGEFAYLSYEERTRVTKDAIEAVAGRVPLVVGAGFGSRIETLKFIEEVGRWDVDGFLVVVPTYYPAGFDAVYDSFSLLCDASRKPIFYYHFPQVTGLFFSPQQIAKLLAIEGMAGMKDSIVNMREMRAHIEWTGKLPNGNAKSIFSGHSFAIPDTLKRGGAGAMAILPSVVPRLIVETYDACLSDDARRAKNLQDRIFNLIPLMNDLNLPVSLQRSAFKLLFRSPIALKNKPQSRVAVIKETLRQLGHPIGNRVRSPQPQLAEGEAQQIAMLIRRNELAM
ncbi:MAG: dihydrodipicolinate synthase family protein [Myxococcales bacterium]|jgi:dihydrodipicolinate synthase/N-acetylneuraminate lyase|nr:dihydrodipicolinate synthase family protein [Myxococcales bacterium]